VGIFIFTTASRSAVGSTQPPIQRVPWTLSRGVRREGREADHSSPSSAEVKNVWTYTSTPQYVFLAWCLVKYRDNFTFYLYPSSRPLPPKCTASPRFESCTVNIQTHSKTRLGIISYYNWFLGYLPTLFQLQKL
jgi:hypothetical protein